MSVIAIVLDESNIDEMRGWSASIALSFDVPLKVFCVQNNENFLEFSPSVSSKPEGGLQVTDVIVSIEEVEGCLRNDLKSSSSRLLLIDHPVARRGRRADLVKKILSLGICDSIVLRFPTDGGLGGGKILLPTCGGRHSLKALKFAEELAQGDDEGKLVPLFVEQNIHELSKEVGKKRLDGILLKSGCVQDSDKIESVVVVGNDVSASVHSAASEGGYDLVLLGASESGILHRSFFGTLPDRLLREDGNVAVGIFHEASRLSEKLRVRVKDYFNMKVPQLDRKSRVDLFESIESNAQWSFDFVALICFSTALASLGLMLDSSPVIIGAMLVAPLMTPILGAGLSLVQGNKTLMIDCLKSVLFGYFSALLIGVFLGLFGIFDGATDQILSRTNPEIADLLIAFISGMAAAYCFSRPKLVSALAGVAIAAALVPPIATAGIGIALGKPGIVSGSTLLFATNVVFIILGASITFVAVGVRGDSEGRDGRIWVNRAILILIVIGAILVIPLGSKLIEKMSNKISGHSEVSPSQEKG
jgi:uncharacterized hydrophobic protein (TIGR00271 family)